MCSYDHTIKLKCSDYHPGMPKYFSIKQPPFRRLMQQNSSNNGIHLYQPQTSFHRMTGFVAMMYFLSLQKTLAPYFSSKAPFFCSALPC